MKNVTEMMTNIEKEIRDKELFEEYLFNKYPSLFYHDEKGCMLPQTQRCWSDCPDGWQLIVDNLCGAIVSHAQTSRYVPDPKKYIIRFIIKYFRVIKVKLNKLPIPGIKKLTSKISCLLIKKSIFIKVKPQPIKVAQFKEKFGSLRFYIDGNDDQVDGMIAFAEYLSLHTCQNTGKPGQLCKSAGYCYATLSEEEAKDKNYTPVQRENI